MLLISLKYWNSDTVINGISDLHIANIDRLYLRSLTVLEPLWMKLLNLYCRRIVLFFYQICSILN